VFSHLGVVPTSDICAQIADFLIHVKEAKWALVSGITQGRLTVVFRCDGHRKHAGKIAETAFGSLGSAGGHRNAARAEVEEDAIPQGNHLYENEAMEWFILDRLARSAGEFGHLRDSLPGQPPAT
jgi:nanoRNase/pAp phosphatase (c-di-AMP/oligoRNAs hydrolase)